MKMATLVRVVREGATHRVEIDGQEFPYYLAEDGPRVEGFSRSNAPVVWLPVIADRIETVNDLGILESATWRDGEGPTHG